MTIPDFFYVKAFWQSLSYVAAGVLGLLALFDKIDPQWALTPAALLVIFLGALKFFDIEPQVKLRRMLANMTPAKAKGTKKAK